MVKIGLVVLNKNFFYWSYQWIFTMPKLSPLRKRRGPSFEKLQLPLSKDALWQFGIIGPMVLEKIYQVGDIIFAIIPIGIGLGPSFALHPRLLCANMPLRTCLSLNKHKSPLPKNALCQVWLVLEKKISKWHD